MTGFTIYRGNFIQNNVYDTTTSSDICLAYTLWNDLLNNGFSLVSADNTTSQGATDLTQTKIIILKPSTDIDPLWNTNMWYLAFRVDDVGSVIYNTLQKDSNGNPIPVYYENSQLQVTTFGWIDNTTTPSIDSTSKTISGMKSSWSPIIPGLMYPNQSDGGSYTNKPPRIYPQRPYGYILSIVKRGFIISIFDQTLDNMNYNGIYCVQRGVDTSGNIKTTGKTPLYCVTNICSVFKDYDGQNSNDVEKGPGPVSSWMGWIVRETDTIVPDPVNNLLYGNSNNKILDEFEYPMTQCSISEPNELTGRYVHRFPSFWDGPVTTDTGEYLVVLPYGICSSRYTYTDEIDLIAVSKSDAYQPLQQIPITLYGDSRTYSAQCSNSSVAVAHSHNAIRPFILVGGNDFSK